MLATIEAKLIGLFIIVALVGGGFWYVSHLRSEVATDETTITTLKGELQTLGDQVKAQNAAVDALKADSDKRLAQAATDLAAAQAAAAKKTAAAKIIYVTKPSVPGKTCDDDRTSALNLLNGVPAAAASGASK
jgi:FtsZ-interacting cell division protein ZipA